MIKTKTFVFSLFLLQPILVFTEVIHGNDLLLHSYPQLVPNWG